MATPPMYRECAHCKKQMRRDASVCPHCRMTSEAWVFAHGYWYTHDERGKWILCDEATGEASEEVEDKVEGLKMKTLPM